LTFVLFSRNFTCEFCLFKKKSRLESVGAGSGVEIIENKPYESDNEKGQYTLKVYHVDERLPGKTIELEMKIR